MAPWKRRSLLKTIIFRFYVKTLEVYSIINSSVLAKPKSSKMSFLLDKLMQDPQDPTRKSVHPKDLLLVGSTLMFIPDNKTQICLKYFLPEISKF